MRTMGGWLRVVVACGVLTSMVGCNCDPTGDHDAGSGGGAAGIGGGSAGAGGGSAGSVGGSGTITLSQASLGTLGLPGHVYGGNASFSTIRVVQPPSCLPVLDGNCLTQSCAISQLDAGRLEATPESAGTVTVTGAREPVAFTPLGDGGYSHFTVTAFDLLDGGHLWDGGEVLTASASGGAVPPFSAQVVAPSVLTAQLPNCDGGSCSLFDRAVPLTVSWTGGPYGEVWVGLQTYASGKWSLVECSFPASAGTGTIGPARLAPLQPTTVDGGFGVFTVWTWGRTTVDAGSFQVLFVAEQPVLSLPLTVRPIAP